MPKLAFSLLLVSCLCGCGASSQPAIVIPSNVVADSIVVPAELESEYQQLQANPGGTNLDIWVLMRSPATAKTQPLSFRRAFLYYMFDGARGHSLLELRTMPSKEGSYDALMSSIAQQFDFTIRYSTFRDSNSPEDGGTTDYNLTSNRALSLGELAWIADWILSNHPNQILVIDPFSDTDIVNSN